MKTTGMVRRVDSLGRIVIPKEIRKVLKIKENEKVEINVSGDEIVLNRYSDLSEFDESLKVLFDIISSIYKVDILLTDLNVFNLTTKDYMYLEHKEISPYLSNVLDERLDVLEKNKISISLSNSVDDVERSFLIKTLIVNGDSVGLIIFLSDDITSIDPNLIELVYKYLEKKLE
ncbi:MAG: AbrB/MazE/SpoVT family DNA-binding domain-containing protein [Bacilli bacterium]|nr:AbrB/MazE/SpoVT family DNA-binding domain-containing protein [Bacilli bacterium]